MSQTTQDPASQVCTACAVCGAASPSQPPPFTWSPAWEAGRRTWTCEPCARANIRNIESKLDSRWW